MFKFSQFAIFTLLLASVSPAFGESTQKNESTSEAKKAPSAQSNSLLGKNFPLDILPKEVIQGPAISEFKLGHVYVLGLWNDAFPGNVSRPHMAVVAGGEKCHLIMLQVNDQSNTELTRKRLSLPSVANPAVTVLKGYGNEAQGLWNFLKDSKPSERNFAVIIKDGKIAWCGQNPSENISITPELVSAILKPDFDAIAFDQKNKDKAEANKAIFKRGFVELNKLIRDNKIDEAKALMEDMEKNSQPLPEGLQVHFGEMRINFSYYPEKDPKKLLKAIEDFSDKFATSNYAQDRALRYLNSIAEIKESGKPVAIKCLKRLIETKSDNDDYVRHCYVILARVYKELGQKENAIEAFQKALQHTPLSRKLNAK